MDNNTDVLEGVAEPIRGLMQSAGLSVNALAAEALIPRSTLRRKLLAPEQLTMGDLLAIARALDCPAHEIFPIVPMGSNARNRSEKKSA